MNRLWAPWRAKYITKLMKKNEKCIFCRMLRQTKDKENYIFIRTKSSFAVLNIYPYNNGHVLLVPNKHVPDLSRLEKTEKDDLFDLLELTKSFLDKVLRPQGYNIGMNIGKIAGAGFPGHLHIHVVPRWAGDSNFMPVIGNTKIVSQSLAVLHSKLKKCAHEKKLKR